MFNSMNPMMSNWGVSTQGMSSYMAFNPTENRQSNNFSFGSPYQSWQMPQQFNQSEFGFQGQEQSFGSFGSFSFGGFQSQQSMFQMIEVGNNNINPGGPNQSCAARAQSNCGSKGYSQFQSCAARAQSTYGSKSQSSCGSKCGSSAQSQYAGQFQSQYQDQPDQVEW